MSKAGNNIVVHISGFPGSGKTTLGEKLQRMFKNIIVYDTDGFIQHHTKEGKQLVRLEKQNKNREYKTLWKETIKNKINEFISKYHDKIIVFVGSLDNFAPPGVTHNIKADHKYVLDVPLDELLRRYYLRIYYTDKKAANKKANEYWKKLSNNVYHIHSSDDIINNRRAYNKWHKDHGYKFLDDNHIISNIRKIITSVV